MGIKLDGGFVRKRVREREKNGNDERTASFGGSLLA